MSWYTYMLRCADNTLYSGVTTDLERRVGEHNGAVKGAKYTKARQPVVLVYSKKVKNRSDAQKHEAHLRTLSRTDKLLLVERH